MEPEVRTDVNRAGVNWTGGADRGSLTIFVVFFAIRPARRLTPST